MKRNKFSLSHYKLFSCDMGELVPIGLVEVLPGDTFQHATSALIRVSPLLAPVMHPVHVRIHHWFVPHRLVWQDFEKFITGGADGFDASVFPTRSINDVSGVVGQLADYLGVPAPMPAGASRSVNALPFRGYNLIWNEFYRDQDLETAAAIQKTSGADGATEVALRRVSWEKDYFTSARPWTQKGPEVSIPLQGDAPVKGLFSTNQTYVVDPTAVYESGATGSQTNKTTQTIGTVPSGNWRMEGTATSGGFPNIRADLSDVTAANINDLRLAFALQRYEEARARYGSRYTEYLRHLGVRSSDARLQRPEYLGGGKQTIQFSEVLQTSPDDAATTGVGRLRGHGIASLRSNRYRRFFEEHGFVFSLMSVRPRTMYSQGIHRHWNRRVKEDFHQKELEHIGQQEVINKEIMFMTGIDEQVFGYQDRYDEYRRMESGIAGEFRTTALDFWHMARQFTVTPVLNASFVSAVPTKRINAVQTNDVLWIMANHSIQARRNLSRTGTSHIF